MNNLKRFIRQAEMSHYALFRCYMFLQSCGNGDVLLQNARAEHNGLPEACSIIYVLEEFLSEQPVITAHWWTDVVLQKSVAFYIHVHFSFLSKCDQANLILLLKMNNKRKHDHDLVHV